VRRRHARDLQPDQPNVYDADRAGGHPAPGPWLDQVVDLAEETSDKIDLYKIQAITDSASSLASAWPRPAASWPGRSTSWKTSRHRRGPLRDSPPGERGDSITRVALQKLFETNHKTAADVIKWKDLYSLLESTLDECESVAEIVETIAIKNA